MTDLDPPERLWRTFPFDLTGASLNRPMITEKPYPGGHEYVLLEAIRANPEKFGVYPGTNEDDEALTIAYLKGVEDGKAVVPEVKALEWANYVDAFVNIDEGHWTYSASMARYSISESISGFVVFYGPLNNPKRIGAFETLETLEAAKAAAQAHFERLIKECLE